MKTLRILSQQRRITAIVFIVSMLAVAGLRAGKIRDAAAAGDLDKDRALLDAYPALLESTAD